MKKIPRSVRGIAGQISVRSVREIPKDADAGPGHVDWGMWEPAKRHISIVSSETPRWQRLVYYHEWVHAALDDTGLSHLLSKEHEEAICDCIATARLAEDGEL